MIRIGQPRVKECREFAFLENNIEIDGVSSLLWFKVDCKYKDYLCYERGDAYLVACLHFAMSLGHDIKLDVPISEKLLFNLRNYLIPALIENNPNLHCPIIIAASSNSLLPNAGAIGTGISCGVDSLHALSTKSFSEYQGLNITHLAFNNVGSHGEGEAARLLFSKRLNRPKQFAKEFKFEFVASDSNLMDIIKQSHFHTHTYSSMFPILCLQKLYKTYFYASAGYKFNEFDLHHRPNLCCGSYELLSLQCFSTDTCTILSDGMGKTRLMKLEEVVSYEPSYRYLNVCITDGNNCGVCEKCVRTLLELDILGALDKYSAVFDILYYKNNKNWYLKQLLYHKASGKHDYFEIYQNLKKEIPLLVRIQSIPKVAKIHLSKFIQRSPFLYSIVKSIRK